TLLGLDEIGKSIMDTALGTMFIDSGSVMLRSRDENRYKYLIQAGEKDLDGWRCLVFFGRSTAGEGEDAEDEDDRLERM
ncbi:MAG: hypothetical protein GY759_06825, partial [Chloroflexi bacterium]|nr:hypothetical protein [Chloroflexota bacterium]